MKKRYCIFLTAALTGFGCGYNDFGELPPPGYETLPANADIGFIVSMYGGKPLNIADDIIVSGIVTANDEADNFYRTFIIEDATGAVEVRAGIFDLHNIFPLGRCVAVKARGLVLDSYNGVAQLGLKPSGGTLEAGYISNRYYPGSYLWPQHWNGEVTPVTPGPGGLTDGMCGRLVRITDVEFIPGELEGGYITWAEQGAGGYRLFRGEGGEITVVTSGFADFAAERVPQGKVTLTGILMKGNTDKAIGVFMLKIRNITDVEI